MQAGIAAASYMLYLSLPVLLSVRDMDRITAGAQPSISEQLVSTFNAVQRSAASLSLRFADLASLLTADQQTLISKLASGDTVIFQLAARGESVTTQWLCGFRRT